MEVKEELTIIFGQNVSGEQLIRNTFIRISAIEHEFQLHRSTCEVLRILSTSLLDKTPIKDLFANDPVCDADDGQLSLNFLVDTVVSFNGLPSGSCQSPTPPPTQAV